MTDLQRRITALESQRTAIQQATAGRWRTPTESEQLRLLDKAIASAWDLRRLERAQQPQIDHELPIVTQLKGHASPSTGAGGAEQ